MPEAKLNLSMAYHQLPHFPNQLCQPAVRNYPPGRPLVSIDISADNTSAAGGRQRFALSGGA